MNIPEIRIIYSKFLDKRLKKLFEYHQEAGLISPEAVYPAAESIIEKTKEYQKAWESRKSVLEYMQEVLALNFYSNVIDAYIVGQMKGAFSLPIVISSYLPPNKYIDVLTHEVLHRLTSDNKQQITEENIVSKMLPAETEKCAIHVIIHAMLKKIYLEFLKDPERLVANKERDKNAPDYVRAWEIVETMGENQIIEQFKNYYY